MSTQTQQQDDRKTSLEVPQNSPQAPLAPKKPEDSVETASERMEARRMETKTESLQQRTDVSLKSLQERTRLRNYDQETENLIDGINFSESPEVQKKGWKALAGVSVILMSLAIRENPRTDFSDFSKMQQFTETFSPVHSTERKAVRKLLELAAHGDSNQTRFISARWAALAAESRTLAREIRSLENMGNENQEQAEASLETEQKKKSKKPEKNGFWAKTGSFLKNNGVQIGAGLLIIAGAVGLYKVLKGNDETPAVAGAKKESGGILKWLVGAGIAVAGLFGLGRLLGMDGIKDFFKKHFDWNVDNSHLAKALTLIAEGKFMEAGETLWEGTDDNAELHTKLAEYMTKDMQSKVPVTGKTLFEIRDEGFDAFINGFGQTQDDLSLWARQYGGDFVSYIGFDTKKKNEEQIVVRKFLEKHETHVREIFKKNGKEVDDDTTVEDVLLALDTDIRGVPEQQESAEPRSIDEIIETEPGKAGLGVDGTTAVAIREAMKDKKQMQKFFEKYEGQYFKAVTSPREFFNDLFTACNKDGIGVVLAEGSIFLIHKDKELLFASGEILYDTAVALALTPTDENNWGDVVGTYLKGSMTFIAIGAAAGGFKGGLKGLAEKNFWGGLVGGGLKGGFKGVLFPVEIQRLHVSAGQYVYRTAKGAAFEVKKSKLFSTPEVALQVTEAQARFHAEIAARYDDLITRSGKDVPLLKRNWYGWYTRDRAEVLRQKHLKRFQLSYNELVEKLNPDRVKSGLAPLARVTDPMLHGESRMVPVIDFLNHGSHLLPTARPIEVAGTLFKSPDGTARKLDDIKADADRLRKEVAGLPADDVNRAAKAKELLALDAYLRPTQNSAKLEIQAADFGGLDESGRAAKVMEAASSMEAVEKGVQARFNAEVEKIVAEAKLNKIPLTDPAITARLENLDHSIVLPFAKKKQGALKTLVAEYGRVPNKLKTPLLRSQMRLAIEGASGTLMTRVIKGAKGRAKMMVLMGALMFATNEMIRQGEVDREFSDIIRELGPEAGQLLIDVLPFIGTYSSFYSAFTGEELVTPRDVSGTWDRVSNVIWGSVGLAGDVVTVLSAIPTGGGSLGVNVILRLTKMAKSGSRTAPIVLRMWPRIARVAERMGGWLAFGKKAKDAIGGKIPLMAGLRKIEAVGTVAGTALMVGGVAYHMRYAFMNDETEIELPADLQAEAPAQPATPVAQQTAEPEAPAESGN